MAARLANRDEPPPAGPELPTEPVRPQLVERQPVTDFEPGDPAVVEAARKAARERLRGAQPSPADDTMTMATGGS